MVKALPQLHVTSVTVYSGWIPVFKILSLSEDGRRVPQVDG